jgi:soluble lytic murein transglycosylase
MMDYLEKIPAHTLRASFEKGLIHYERGEYLGAMDSFKSVEKGDFADASLYWQGKVELAQGHSEQATANWLSLQQRYPLSFYSYRAFDTTQVIPSYDPTPFIPPTKSSKKLPARITALLNADSPEDAYYEAKTFYPSEDAVWANLYWEYKDQEQYHYLFRLNERYPSPFLAYPLVWESMIKDDLVKNDKTMDPYLVMALIREESNYNPRAISVSDARGLMQLMSFTAAGAAKSLKLPQYDLFEPSDNIHIGYFHMKWVVNYLGVQKGIASYNCGTGALSRFRKIDDLDLFIESIPYPETNRYVKKVLKSYWIYKLMYDRDSKNIILL